MKKRKEALNILLSIDIYSSLSDESVENKIEKILYGSPKIKSKTKSLKFYIDNLNGIDIYVSPSCRSCIQNGHAKRIECILYSALSKNKQKNYTSNEKGRILLTIKGKLEDIGERELMGQVDKFIDYLEKKEQISVMGKCINVEKRVLSTIHPYSDEF